MCEFKKKVVYIIVIESGGDKCVETMWGWG